MSKYILGIETTCDETAASIVDNNIILSNTIASQVDIHTKFGGVVPEVASRYHMERLPIVVNQAISESKIKIEDISAIAVATNPGLAPALAVGYSYASALALNLDIPIISVNHLYAHIWANFLSFKDEHTKMIPERFLTLLVSGGHTQLIDCTNVNGDFNLNIVGETVDDAVGECIDKVARLLNIAYPGGPNLEKLALSGNNNVKMPLPMLTSDNYNFSFSGIKSHISRLVGELIAENAFDSNKKADIANSFQESIFEILSIKSVNYAIENGIKNIYLAGGVAANMKLRNKLSEKCLINNLELNSPPLVLCTDNAAMIAGFAFNLIKKST